MSYSNSDSGLQFIFLCPPFSGLIKRNIFIAHIKLRYNKTRNLYHKMIYPNIATTKYIISYLYVFPKHLFSRKEISALLVSNNIIRGLQDWLLCYLFWRKRSVSYVYHIKHLRSNFRRNNIGKKLCHFFEVNQSSLLRYILPRFLPYLYVN